MSVKSKILMLLASDASHVIPDRTFLKWKFRLLMGRRLDLKDPRSYSEKLQWLKLYDRDPVHTSLADKVAVKDIVAQKIGRQYVIPTLGVWEKAEDINFGDLPERFVLKCSHDSGSAVICKDRQSFDCKSARASLAQALKKNFFYENREWPYKDIRPAVLAEPFLADNIKDYKFFCFDGVPRIMFIASDRESKEEETRFDFFDMDFNLLPFTNGHPHAQVPPSKPEGWDRMIELAGILSSGMRHVRIDFYQVGGRIYFGEYTFFHWGGAKPFDPEEWDYRIGNMIRL